MKYPFRDDNGKIHNLSFEQMIEARDGFYEKDDGTILRRVRGDSVPVRSAERQRERPEIVSDSMGFGQHQLPEMREHLEANKIRGVEFVRDPSVPEFFQVKCSSERAKSRYMKSRGYHDHNSKNGSGAMLSEKDFEDAKDLVLRNAK